jgi:flagellin-like hook-associated protein FlgL
VRGLAAAIQVRFDGIHTQQADMKQWLGRLSEAIDRQSEVTAKLVGVELRLGHNEADISDLRLDVDELGKNIGAIETENVKTHFVRNGFLAVITSTIVGIVIAVFGGIFHNGI